MIGRALERLIFAGLATALLLFYNLPARQASQPYTEYLASLRNGYTFASSSRAKVVTAADTDTDVRIALKEQDQISWTLTMSAMKTSETLAVNESPVDSVNHEDRISNDLISHSKPKVASPPSTSASSSIRPLTRALVLARKKSEDIEWVMSYFANDSSLQVVPYTVDDAHSHFSIPANKGHEAMVYLTYIISRHSAPDPASGEPDQLPDISIFMHAHQMAWHNNDLLDRDAAKMLSRLRTNVVMEKGYANLRCHRTPGCDVPLRPLEPIFNPDRPEERILLEAWQNMFPEEPIPSALAAPCCSQFAVSRDRIRSVPKERYEALRDWLRLSTYEDSISGRIWEYTWQYLFMDQHELCPTTEHDCYCELYGVCFEAGEDGFAAWFGLKAEIDELKNEYVSLWDMQGAEPQADWLESRRAYEIQMLLAEKQDRLVRSRQEAMERGDSTGATRTIWLEEEILVADGIDPSLEMGRSDGLGV